MKENKKITNTQKLRQFESKKKGRKEDEKNGSQQHKMKFVLNLKIGTCNNNNIVE
jgi:hypothetical protein